MVENKVVQRGKK